MDNTCIKDIIDKFNEIKAKALHVVQKNYDIHATEVHSLEVDKQTGKVAVDYQHKCMGMNMNDIVQIELSEIGEDNDS